MADESPASVPRTPAPGWRLRYGAPLLIVLAALLVHAAVLRGGLYESDEWLALNLGQLTSRVQLPPVLCLSLLLFFFGEVQGSIEKGALQGVHGFRMFS